MFRLEERLRGLGMVFVFLIVGVLLLEVFGLWDYWMVCLFFVRMFVFFWSILFLFEEGLGLRL